MTFLVRIELQFAIKVMKIINLSVYFPRLLTGLMGRSNIVQHPIQLICQISKPPPTSVAVISIKTTLMMKTQLGLGVLSIPVVFDTLGLVPGVLSLGAIAAITSWVGYMIGVTVLPSVGTAKSIPLMILARRYLVRPGVPFWVLHSASICVILSCCLERLADIL